MFPQYWLYTSFTIELFLATWWQIIWPKSDVFSQSLSLCCWSVCLYFEQYHAVRITKFFYVLKISHVRISPSRVILFAVLLWIFMPIMKKKWPTQFPQMICSDVSWDGTGSIDLMGKHFCLCVSPQRTRNPFFVLSVCISCPQPHLTVCCLQVLLWLHF